MLKKFSVKGYRNFKETITLDLSRKGKYDFQKELIQNGVVNKGIIYGKNGSGKSNLGRALFDIEKNLMINNSQNIFAVDLNPTFCSLDSKEDAFFSYAFVFGQDELVYEYTKKSVFSITSEKIFVNGELMFLYNGDKNKVISNFPGTEKLSFASMNEGLSALLFLYRTFKFDENSPISKLFHFVSGMLWFRCLNQGNEFEGRGIGENIEQRIIKEDKLADFKNFLADAGLHYDLVLKPQINPSTGRSIQRIFAKFAYGSVPLNAIFSTGTQALELFYYWSINFHEYSFVFIDEFDAFYHYELSAAIIKKLNEDTHFQSFVTTHNTSLMNNDLMRPDCLFLIGNNHIANLADCTSKDLRQGHNLEKIYRSNDFHV